MNIFDEGKVLLINKPYDWTSFDVVKKIRGMVRTKKVGHAGTLDPLATGLLIVCTGKFTKKINEYMSQEKEYIGTFTLGGTTGTYDLESVPGNFKDYSHITKEVIIDAALKFTGSLRQIPPMHSAIKKDGKKLYEIARKGKEITLEARNVYIKEFRIEKLEMPVMHFTVICSTGTYIRSLANDFGGHLGCGAYLSDLCRTRIGNFLLKDSLTIESAAEMIGKLLNQNG